LRPRRPRPGLLWPEARLLALRDLPERQAELVRGRVAPVPEPAPDSVRHEVRVEDEREGQEGPVFGIRELEQVEVLADPPILVREERKLRADPRAEGAVDVGPVDGDGAEPAVLALHLLLQ